MKNLLLIVGAGLGVAVGGYFWWRKQNYDEGYGIGKGLGFGQAGVNASHCEYAPYARLPYNDPNPDKQAGYAAGWQDGYKEGFAAFNTPDYRDKACKGKILGL